MMAGRDAAFLIFFAGDRTDDGLAVGIHEDRQSGRVAIAVKQVGHAGLPVDPCLLYTSEAGDE